MHLTPSIATIYVLVFVPWLLLALQRNTMEVLARPFLTRQSIEALAQDFLQPNQTAVTVRCSAEARGEDLHLVWQLEHRVLATKGANETVMMTKDGQQALLRGGCLSAVSCGSEDRKMVNQHRSSLYIRFDNSSRCTVMLRNTSVTGFCATSNALADPVSHFRIQIPGDFLMLAEGQQVLVWNGWPSSDEQRLLHSVRQKRAYGFICGMLIPVGILLYIAFYLSCFRNSAHVDANMFNSENL